MAKTITITARAFALLARPVTGQGGYQSRLRNLQAELGIEPDDSLQAVSPGSYQGPIEMSRAVAAPTAPIKSKRDVLIDKLMMALGMDEPTPVGEPVRVYEPSRRQADRLTLEESDVDSEEDLARTLAKAQRVRQEKAALHMVGRSRKSPKLSNAERERRAERMRGMWAKARKAGKASAKVAKRKVSKRR